MYHEALPQAYGCIQTVNITGADADGGHGFIKASRKEYQQHPLD